MSEIQKVIEQLQAGRPVIICDDEDREGEGDIAFAASMATPDMVNMALLIGRGLLCLSLGPEDASRLGIKKLHSNNKDAFGTPFGMPIGIDDNGSGISSRARAATLNLAAKKDSSAEDFVHPGHVATLLARPGGVLERDGHTEAVLDILKLADIDGPGVLCEVLMPDGRVAKRPFLESLAKERDFPILEIKNIQNILMSEKEKMEAMV